MKTTLALLIAGLIFLATPILASADGKRHDGIQNYYKGWVKSDRHDHRYQYDRHDNRRNHRYEQKHDRHAKKHLQRELRENQQELRQIKKQIRRNNRRPYYARPYYTNPAVIIGLPHIVFQFDW